MPTRDDVLAAARSAAAEAGIPVELLVACGIAESNLTADARRPRDQAQDAAYWPDVSFGAWQQTVRWAPEYQGGAQYPGADEVLRVGRLYLDPSHAARVAARQLAANYRKRPDDLQWVLERYNKPNGEVTAGVRANYARGLAEARRILGEPPPAPAPSGIVYEDYRDPEPAGRFASMPKGIILHGSRSGRAGNPKAAEYRGTASWEVNNPGGLGWHATVGEGVVAVHLEPTEWGWNARAASDEYLAVEIAQATVDEPVTDAQVDALADWITTRVLPVWPGLPMRFPSHAEVEKSGETGAIDGKTDVFPAGDPRMDELRSRLVERLGAMINPPKPVPAPSDELAMLRKRVAALEAQLADKSARLDGEVSKVGYLTGDVGDALQAIVDTLRRHKPPAA